MLVVQPEKDKKWRQETLKKIGEHEWNSRTRLGDILADDILPSTPFIENLNLQDDLPRRLLFLVHAWRYLFEIQKDLLASDIFKEAFLTILHKGELFQNITEPSGLKLTGEHKLHIFWGFLTDLIPQVFQSESKDDDNKTQEVVALANLLLGKDEKQGEKFVYAYERIKARIDMLSEALPIMFPNYLDKYSIENMTTAYWNIKELCNSIPIDKERSLQKNLKEQLLKKLWQVGKVSDFDSKLCAKVFKNKRQFSLWFTTDSSWEFDIWRETKANSSGDSPCLVM